MTISSLKCSVVIGLISCLGITAVPAFAQQDPAKPEQTQEEKKKDETTSPQTASEEIVVTARKREENVQDVPVAVTVVTADKLEEAAATDLSELQTQVPNLTVYQGRN